MSNDLPVRDLDLTEVKEGLRDGRLCVVDVREPNEFATGSIPGSVSMPLSRFRPGDLPTDRRRIVFSCAAGIRSLRAVQLARAAGLDLNEHYVGGFNEWARSGEPVA